jgi:hypothetical protein
MEDERPYTRELVRFAEALRERDVVVSPDAVVDAGRALAVVDPLDREQFYYALRATLVDDPAAFDAFDEAFARFWEAEPSPDDFDAVPLTDDTQAFDDTFPPGERDESADGDDGGDAASEGGNASSEPTTSRRPERRPDGRDPGAGDLSELAVELGRQEGTTDVDVSILDDGRELAALSRLVRKFGRQLGVLPGFRRRAHPSGELDLRDSLNVVREPTPADLPRVEADRSRAKARFFVDVSHSMLRNMDQAFLLLFLFECVQQFADVRVFMFDTSATEVTAHFRAADVERTLAALRAEQTRWGAGTTIGACLAEMFAADPFVVDRETVAIVVSDGWDAGDVELLEAQLRYLERHCRRTVWLNPRATADEYEPTVSGMAAALPYLDHFFGFATLDDLRLVVDGLQTDVPAP